MLLTSHEVHRAIRQRWILCRCIVSPRILTHEKQAPPFLVLCCATFIYCHAPLHSAHAVQCAVCSVHNVPRTRCAWPTSTTPLCFDANSRGRSELANRLVPIGGNLKEGRHSSVGCVLLQPALPLGATWPWRDSFVPPLPSDPAKPFSVIPHSQKVQLHGWYQTRVPNAQPCLASYLCACSMRQCTVIV